MSTSKVWKIPTFQTANSYTLSQNLTMKTTMFCMENPGKANLLLYRGKSEDLSGGEKWLRVGNMYAEK